MLLKESIGRLLLSGVILLSLVGQGPPAALSAYAQNSEESEESRSSPGEPNRVIMRIEIKREAVHTQYLEKGPPPGLRFGVSQPVFDRSTLIGMSEFEDRFLAPLEPEENELPPEAVIEPELQMVEVEPETIQQPRVISSLPQETIAPQRKKRVLDVDSDFGHYTPDDFIFFYKKDMSDEQKSALLPFLATENDEADQPAIPSSATLIEE